MAGPTYTTDDGSTAKADSACRNRCEDGLMLGPFEENTSAANRPRRAFREEPLSFWTTSVRVARSASVSRTKYFFCMAEPSVVAAILPKNPNTATP
jgi:hypothetical protein